MSIPQKTRLDVFKFIHQILIDEWDPMGAKEHPLAQDEYDVFVQSIYSLLEAKATEEQIFEELQMIALEDLGIEKSKTLEMSSRKASQKIIKLKV